jgi:hypothetical protein
MPYFKTTRLIYLCILLTSTLNLFSNDFGLSDIEYLESITESKLSPVINCPADLEIECGWDWESMSGPASGFNNGFPVETVLTVEDLTSDCGIGIIRATYCTVQPVGSSQPPACCTQIVTVLDSGSNFDPNAISFQNDQTIVCNSIPGPQQPQWGEGACDLIGWTYEDENFWFEDGLVVKY